MGNNLKRITIDPEICYGKPLMKMIDEQADIWAFVMYNLGMSYKKVE